ncbi:hypothetical protein DMENIID0001_027970 [Sergentomyia squamirostris]
MVMGNGTWRHNVLLARRIFKTMDSRIHVQDIAYAGGGPSGRPSTRIDDLFNEYFSSAQSDDSTDEEMEAVKDDKDTIINYLQ